MRKPPTQSIRRSVVFDPIHPRDWRELEIIFTCEQCSHFAPATKTCTIGYPAEQHTREFQEKQYALTGRVAFCRFCEID